MASYYLMGQTPDKVEAVCNTKDILKIKKAVSQVTVKESILGYIEDIIALTREEQRFVLGASPRALLALLCASQSRAFLQGRDYVKPDDVKAVALQVLLHRLVLSSEARLQKADAAGIVNSLIAKVKIPVAWLDWLLPAGAAVLAGECSIRLSGGYGVADMSRQRKWWGGTGRLGGGSWSNRYTAMVRRYRKVMPEPVWRNEYTASGRRFRQCKSGMTGHRELWEGVGLLWNCADGFYWGYGYCHWYRSAFTAGRWATDSFSGLPCCRWFRWCICSVSIGDLRSIRRRIGGIWCVTSRCHTFLCWKMRTISHIRASASACILLFHMWKNFLTMLNMNCFRGINPPMRPGLYANTADNMI